MKPSSAQWGLSEGDDVIVPIMPFKVRGFRVLVFLLFFMCVSAGGQRTVLLFKTWSIVLTLCMPEDSWGSLEIVQRE